MPSPIHNPRPNRRAVRVPICGPGLLTLLAALLCALAVIASAAATTMPAPKESLAAFEAQLRARQVHAATLRIKTHVLHATLVNGSKVAIAVSSQSQQRLLNDAQAAGVTVKVLRPKAASHKRRYIAGAAVLILVLLVVAFVLLKRRRSAREEELGPRAPFPTG
jgi:ATP-dependent Zn protease